MLREWGKILNAIEIEKKSKVKMKLKMTMNSQSNLEQKKKADITQPNFKIYYNVIVIKTCGSGIKTDI